MKTVLPFIVVVACIYLENAATGDVSFPYKARIGDNDTLARCGPGKQYYATEEVPAGAEVEVWRHDPGGWFAIRPLEKSYSLVSPDGLRYTADSDLAQLRSDKVVAWVGSNVEEVDEHKWQVRLMPGESVVVLGQAELQLHRGSRRRSFMRIEPPSGEFRWIHESALSEETPDHGDTDESVELARFRVIVDDKDPKNAPARDAFVTRRTARRDAASERSRAGPDASRASQSKSLLSAKEFNQRLSGLELQLSLLVAQPPERWELTEILNDTTELVGRGSSTLQRARAKRFFEQVEEFDDLKSRFVLLRQSDRLPVGTGTSSGDVATHEDSSDSNLDPSFDGSGWLLPVHSTKRNAPPYALLDGEGRILQFVSPAPGLNLHRYLRKEIGIFGQQSPYTTLEKPHLTAHRVVDLARHRK
ncbi:MAG: hypothetical protein ACC628_06815 [Pirellulaceae bacterium]